MGDWRDISVPIRHGMEHWPGDPDVVIERIRRVEAGDEYNLSALCMGAHTGTHVDAPLHYLEGGASLDEMPLEALIGDATVVSGTEAPPDPGARVLFRCGGEIDPGTARALAAAGVRCVGIDSPSIGSAETHRTLAAAGIWVIEGLDLSAIDPGRYEMICLPLRLDGAEGAPARCVLRALI